MRVGPLSLCPQVLLLPTGLPPPAGAGIASHSVIPIKLGRGGYGGTVGGLFVPTILLSRQQRAGMKDRGQPLLAVPTMSKWHCYNAAQQLNGAW